MKWRHFNLEFLWIDLLCECQPRAYRSVCVASIHFKALRGFISMKAVLQQRCGGSSSQKEHSNRYESPAAVSVWAHAAWWKGSKNSHYHLKVLLKITCVRGRARQRQKGREKVKTLCLNNPRYLQQTRLDRCYTDTPETCSTKCAKKIGDYNPKPDLN